jgi:hypothetical protein
VISEKKINGLAATAAPQFRLRRDAPATLGVLQYRHDYGRKAMVVLYVAGKQVGTLNDNTDLLQKLVEAGETVEFRTDGGKQLGSYRPKAEPICPWEPDLTKEEIDRRVRESKRSSLDEILKRLGAE